MRRLSRVALLTALAVLACPIPAGAQMPPRGIALEVEGVLGYTGVDVEKWARVKTVHRRDQGSGGVNLRLFLVGLDRAHVGFEVGTQRLFQYTLLTRFSGAASMQVIHTVATQHAGVVARFAPWPSFVVDVGGGFRFFDDTSLPATHVAIRYRAFPSRRWSVPLGVRMDMILDEHTTAVPMSFVTGLFIKL